MSNQRDKPAASIGQYNWTIGMLRRAQCAKDGLLAKYPDGDFPIFCCGCAPLDDLETCCECGTGLCARPRSER